MFNGLSKKDGWQVFWVFLAFALMVTVSGISVSNNLQKSFVQTVSVALEEAEKNIKSYLREPKIVFGNIHMVVREMLDRGEPISEVQLFLTKTVRNLSCKTDGLNGFINVYGLVKNELISGLKWENDSTFIPQQQPWYQLAIRNDTMAYTAPYTDIITGLHVISLTQEIFGKNGEYYGVIAFDIDVSWLMGYARSLEFVDGGWGILVNQYLYVIAHPQEKYVGLRLQHLGRDFEKIANMLMADKNITVKHIKDTDGTSAIVYFNRLFNGWFVGAVMPTKSYFATLYDNIIFLAVLGVILACALSVVLLRLSAQNKRSQEENKFKSTFLANMSHEIRTPLNAIVGITEILMQRDCAAKVKDCEDGLGKIHNSCGLLLGIVNDILDFSKIEAGKMEIRPAKYTLASLINDTVHLNMMRIGDKAIDFSLKVDPELPANIIGDELRIKQVLNNILSNAFKYTDSGQVNLCVDFISENAAETMLIFNIRDTGRGMSKEQLGSLFEEYRRFDHNMRVEGTGLGLAITRRLIKLMDGEILVESEPEKGSVFTVRLPQKLADGEVLGKEAAENLSKFNFSENENSRMKNRRIMRERMPYGRVLVVDDVKTNLYVAVGLMELYGLKIDTATSGKDAIQLVQDGNVYDVIFMDHMMPEMDGIEATARLRRLGYKGLIVALTANALTGNNELFLKNGFNDFIPKPIDSRQLNDILNKYVRDRHANGK